jgi:hypothetical protein
MVIRIVEPSSVEECDNTNCQEECVLPLAQPDSIERRFVGRAACRRRKELLEASDMPSTDVPEILRTKWEGLEEEQNTDLNHIRVDGQEFYTFAVLGNLLFTPEEIERAKARFKSWPNQLELDGVCESLSKALIGEGFRDCGIHPGLPGTDESARHFLRGNKELITIISTSQPDLETVETLTDGDEM